MRTKMTMILMGAVAATVLWPSGVAQGQVVRDGLLSYWTFDAADISGRTAKDAWGDRDGTIVGDTAVVAGKIGDALEFDRDGDYVEFDDADLPTGNAPRTMSVWIKPEGAGVRSALEWGTNATGQRCAILVLAGERIKFCGQGADVTSSRSVVNGEWHHVTETYDGTTVRIYIDGVLDVAQAVLINTVPNVGRIGANIRGGEFFEGSIDEACIYGRALSDAEVAQNFSATKGLARSSASVVEPQDGAADVPRDDVVLIWEPGDSAVSHDVYFGLSWQDVNDATMGSPEFKGNQTETTYVLDRLELGRTYYWRVDEVNNVDPNSPWRGAVWSFTVEPIGYPLPAGSIVATASSAKNAEEGPENVVNGSGLDVNDLHSVTVADMWRTVKDDENPWIQFAFDKPYMLHEMVVWNHNSALERAVGFGIKEAMVEYSLDGVEWTLLDTGGLTSPDANTVQFDRATGQPGYGANTVIPFAGSVAQYVRILPISNWGGILTQFGLSEVRFLYVPVRAREPEPVFGATGVDPGVVLSWRAGRQAATHQVYLSDDATVVADGTALVAEIPESFYQSDPLDLGKTYYWRVDEVNEVGDPLRWQGQIWDFTVTDVRVVEDFEGYTNESPNRVFQTWIDGLGFSPDQYFPSGNDGNGSGAIVGYDPVQGDIMETTIVHGGRQAMPVFYDNTGGVTDSVTTRTFAEAQDWTQCGIQGLILYFHGSSANTGSRLYVKINDTKVPYDGDADHLMRAGWSKWYIVLDEFNAATLAAVRSLSIGVQNGGQGMVYIDDITLTSHERDMVIPIEPGQANLVAHYALEGNAVDSTGQHPGRLVGGPAFGSGVIGQAIRLEGVESYVEISGFKGILGANPVTVAAWIKTTSTISGTIVGWGRIGNGQLFEFRVNNNRLQFEHGGGSVQSDVAINDGIWHHVAVTVQANATISYPEVVLWVDGRDNTRPSSDPDVFNLAAGMDARIGSRPANDDRFFVGQIDEVRIYDRALSAGEVAWLAGRTTPFDQ